MKKILTLVLCVFMACSLCSCWIFNENDAAWGSNATKSEDVTPDTTGDAATDDTDAGLQTVDNSIGDGKVEGGIYSCDDYSFPLPELWRDAIKVERTDTAKGGYNIVVRDFYYLQFSDDTPALMMELITCSYSCYNSGALGSVTLMARSSDGNTAYVSVPLDGTLPDGFHDFDSYSSIYEKLGSADFVITPAA